MSWLHLPHLNLAIRWKFLTVMVAIAIIPLVISAWLEVRSVTKLGAQLAAESGRTINERTRQSLQQSLHHLAETLNREASTAELVARLHAKQALTALSSETTSGVPEIDAVLWAEDFHADLANDHYRVSGRDAVIPIDRERQSVFLAGTRKSLDPHPQAMALTRLNALYRDIDRTHRDLFHWQYVALENGLVATFPGHGNYPADFDVREREWYQAQKRAKALLWSPLHTDVATGIAMINVTMPLIDNAGEFLGVSGIDVRLSGLLQSLQVPIKFEYNSEIILAALTGETAGGLQDLLVFAESENQRHQTNWRDKPQPQRLALDNPNQYRAIIAELNNGRSGHARVSRNGKDYLCLYENLHAQRGGVLMMFVPIENLLDPAIRSAEHALLSTERYINSLIPFATLLIGFIVVIAFVGSRRFVQPIKELVAAVERVSDGDFSVRVNTKTGDEFAQLGNAFNAMIPQLEEHTRVRQDLSVARAVQQRLLPEDPPDFPGIEIVGQTLYADQTGGDYYDFIELKTHGSRRLGIVLGDVAGHGIASALMMASVRALLHGSVQSLESPSAVLKHINVNLADDLHAGQFMTLFFLIFDPQTRYLKWADAGHDPAIVYHPDKDEFTTLSGDDIPLGVDSDWHYSHDHQTALNGAELIMLGTDGIWETKSPSGELFGKQRLREILRMHHTSPVGEICAHVLGAIEAFRGELDQHDDLSIVIFRITAASAPPT